MKNQPPNAAEKRWRESVRSLGSIISGGPAVIHHCAGRAAKHNKVSIGHWWILPLTDAEHKELHADPDRKLREKQLFNRVLDRCWVSEIRLPTMKICEAIEDYHR